MVTISSSKVRRTLVPNSSQFKNALIYTLISALVLIFLNVYSASNTRTLMFNTKKSTMQGKIQVVTSSFSGVDTLSAETVSQIVNVLGEVSVTRLIITDYEGRALYDSYAQDNAEGKLVLLEETVLALAGNDAGRCAYDSGVLITSAAMPIMKRGRSAGCVYMMEYDANQGKIIANLETTTVRSSLLILGAIILLSIIFSMTGSHRMRKILTSMRMVREGEYSHKIQMRGADEFTTLATEFNKLTDKLQQSEQAQRQFVSDASHELKTPLASIKLLSDSILQNSMDADTMREFVADIGNESDRLTRMTLKLLSLSKVDSAAQQEHEVVDLRETVSRVFRMLVPLADQYDVKLTANLSDGCTVLSVEDDAYQIIFNLVENAIKYNHPGGSVRVKLSQEGEDVTLDVQDTGFGIPEENLPHIFERFYRVDKARSRQAGGAGLGLSIVREMVERNFGSIRVTSVLGSGSCFTVQFPYFECIEEDSHAED